MLRQPGEQEKRRGCNQLKRVDFLQQSPYATHVVRRCAALECRLRAVTVATRRRAASQSLHERTRASAVRLTQFSHGGGCGCKIAPGVLQQILGNVGRGAGAAGSCWSASRPPTTPRSTSSTTTRRSSRPPTSSCRSSTIRSTSARIAATNAISDVYAMGGTPIFALALVGMPIDELPLDAIRRDPRRRRVGLRARPAFPIAGGHTIDSVEPIYGLVAIGLVDPRQRQAQRRRARRRRAHPRQAARRRHLQRGAEEGDARPTPATAR